MKIRKITGGVTAAKGFRAASCSAGIKYSDRADMAMVYCEVPCSVAGTFTTNLVKAAPVLWNMDIVKQYGAARAAVVNAGIANAGTGEDGLAVCRATAETAANKLGLKPEEILLGSTGVIGPNLPMEKIRNGIELMVPALSPMPEAGTLASKAIMTTDTVNKEFAFTFDLPAPGGTTVPVNIGGMSKGSGMIHPNMSTMLGFLTTDCAISQPLMQKALSTVVADTFNMISVDGDTSTNDTLLLFADGKAGNVPITAEGEAYELFLGALFALCRELAVTMAGDGEGATHLIEMQVKNMDTKENARILARSVVASSLVKAMIYGRDANCGRILCALGYAGPVFDPDKVDLYLLSESGNILFAQNGVVQTFNEKHALEIMSQREVRFLCDMKMGTESAVAWGCDLTYDYVKINGDYRS